MDLEQELKVNCDQLDTARKRSICRGHDDQGNSIGMDDSKRLAYVKRWFGLVDSGPENSEVYLGDMVSHALSRVGITKDRISKFLGRKCSCAERQEKLNNLDRWARQSTKQSIKAARGFLKKLIGANDVTD